MDRPTRPPLPRLGDQDNPATIGELRAARAVCAALATVALVMLAVHWLGGGAVWLGVVFAVVALVLGVGAVSLHGQLHGWDAPEGAEPPPPARHRGDV